MSTQETQFEFPLPISDIEVHGPTISDNALGSVALQGFGDYEQSVLRGEEKSPPVYRDGLISEAVEFADGELTQEDFGLEYSINGLPDYVEDSRLVNGVKIPTAGLDDLLPLKNATDEIEASGIDLIIGGNQLRLVDLRGEIGIDVDSKHLETSKNRKLLDSHFTKDASRISIGAQIRRTVECAKRTTFYSAGPSKLRTYWRVLETLAEGDEQPVKTIVRLADSGSENGQRALYRQLFGETMRK